MILIKKMKLFALVFILIPLIESYAVKPRFGLQSAIISFFSSLFLPQFHQIPTTNPKSPSVPHQFGIRAEFPAFFPFTKIHLKKRNYCSRTVHAALFISLAAAHNSSEVIFCPFGVRFVFRLKRWMRN